MYQPYGLFVTVDGNKLWKRTVVTRKGTTTFPNTTIEKEILRFSEFPIEKYRVFSDDTDQKVNAAISVRRNRHTERWDIRVHEMAFWKMMGELYTRIGVLEQEDPFDGTLLRAMIDYYTSDILGGIDVSYSSCDLIKWMISEMVGTHMQLMDVLQDMKNEVPPELDSLTCSLKEGIFEQVLTYDERLRAKYCFRSHAAYYDFLLMHFIDRKPRVCQCHYCGGYFIPKTKRKTLYCDRRIRDGMTCKVLGPARKHKQTAEADAVINAFDRNMRKLRKRCERATDSKAGQAVDYTDYWTWLEQAQKARNDYLTGQLAAEDALKVICVA